MTRKESVFVLLRQKGNCSNPESLRCDDCCLNNYICGSVDITRYFMFSTIGAVKFNAAIRWFIENGGSKEDLVEYLL
jgi:hypothetical protein